MEISKHHTLELIDSSEAVIAEFENLFQRSIENCRPLVEVVRQRRKKNASETSGEFGRIVDFGEDFKNPFDEE